jgi:serine/threonine protein kinase
VSGGLSVSTSRTVGRYELIREVGRGGMAVVHLAWQPELQRHVALKELAAFHAADQAAVERFLNESRIAGSLSHPNIVTVHDFFEHEGVPFIAMEYLERQSLRRLVGRLSLAQIAGVLDNLLDALDYAASKELVHRDLKPENVLLTSSGGVKLADFGIAKAYTKLSASGVPTATGTAVGTPAYMSPEQALGRPVGPSSDLYSLGVIAYELLAGRVPFETSETPAAVLLAHVNQPLPDPRALAPELDPRMFKWLERMLAKSPDDRFPGAAEASEVLEGIVIDELGPRWRRDVRLPDPGEGEDEPADPDETPSEGSSEAPGEDSRDALDEEPRAVLADAWLPTAAPRRVPDASAAGENGSASKAPNSVQPGLTPRRVLAVAAIAAVIVGFLASRLGGAPEPAPAEDFVSNGEVAVRPPGGWMRTGDIPELPGLVLKDAIGLTPRGTDAVAPVAFGRVDAEGPGLLPSRLASGVPGAEARRQRVRLGRLLAYRYADLEMPASKRRLTLYVTPTSTGVAAIACDSEQSAAVAEGCDAAARSLKLVRGHAEPLGPSAAYARGLDRAMRALAAARRRAAARLRAARGPGRQATALTALEAAYRSAARRLKPPPVTAETAPAHEALARGLARTAGAFGRAASAARRGNARAYSKARAAVARSQDAVRAGLQELARAGYDVRPPKSRKSHR